MNQAMRQNKEIAEYCGWVRLKRFSIGSNYEYWAGYHPIYHSPLQFSYETPIPNYIGSLDAMHQAEELLDGFLMLNYAGDLMIQLKTGCGSFAHIHAPASARAKAFIKTMRYFKKLRK